MQGLKVHRPNNLHTSLPSEHFDCVQICQKEKLAVEFEATLQVFALAYQAVVLATSVGWQPTLPNGSEQHGGSCCIIVLVGRSNYANIVNLHDDCRLNKIIIVALQTHTA